MVSKNKSKRSNSPVDLKAVLNSRSKEELVALLLDIVFVYPYLVDDFEMVAGSDDQHLPEQAAKIFKDLHPWGHLTEAEAEARMRLVARRAERLAEQGQIDLARRTYYALVIGCVDLYRSYGSHDYFSGTIPYDFAVAYDGLAADQVKDQGEVIKAEFDEIYRGSHEPELLGLNEALSYTWSALLDQGLIEG